jgi:hypothetical protein
VDWVTVFSHYDYVFAVNDANPSYGRFLRERCTLVRESGDAAVFRGCRPPASTDAAGGASGGG